MRFFEFINKPNANILSEGMMDWKEWRKDKYANPFFSAIIDGEDQGINFKLNGEETRGVILRSKENKQTARLMQQQLAAGGKDTKTMAQLAFNVNIVNDDDETTDEVVSVGLQSIFKDDMITGQLRVNLGNIAELVLGCAVTAKYEKLKGEITSDDLISVAIRLAQGSGTVSTTSGKDNISFSASVPGSDAKAFYAYVGEDPKGRSVEDFGITADTIKGINQHINSAVDYVNKSPRVLLAVDKAASDPGKNVVDIISDGGNAEQQKTTKVDLKIAIDGTKLNLLSIKAGRVGQFGQVSGYEFDTLSNFFEQTVSMPLSPKVKKAFADFDTSLSGDERKSNRVQVRETNYTAGFKEAYNEIERGLKSLAKGDQLDLLERVYQGLLHHATRNEEGVEMVILSPNAKSAFYELTFGPELRNALDDYRLEVTRGASDKMHIIEIYGYPKTTKVKQAMGTNKELLVKYRSYAQKAAIRNIIEMGDLLKELADWEKIETRRAAKGTTTAQPLPPKKAIPQTAPAPQPNVGAGIPSGMTSIAPASQAVTPSTDIDEPNELGRIRKNAGITV